MCGVHSIRIGLSCLTSRDGVCVFVGGILEVVMCHSVLSQSSRTMLLFHLLPLLFLSLRAVFWGSSKGLVYRGGRALNRKKGHGMETVRFCVEVYWRTTQIVYKICFALFCLVSKMELSLERSVSHFHTVKT